MLLFFLYLGENYRSDHYCSVQIEKKMNSLFPQNLQFNNRTETEAIETVGMRQSKHKEVSK